MYYIVSLRRVCATNVAVENNMCYIFWVCVCSVRYTACNAHAPYCQLRFVRLYNVFPQCLINGTIFENTLLNTKCVVWFPLKLSPDIFLIPRRTELDMIKNIHCCSWEVPVIFVRFEWRLNFPNKFSKKKQVLNLITSVQWEPNCSMQTKGQTDDKTCSRFPHFWEATNHT
jgi:hypothetical protein